MEAVAGTAQFERLFAQLRRDPDFDAAELLPYDTADALILQTAAERIAGSPPGTVVVIGDTHGALALGAELLGARRIRVHQDALLGERALAQNVARLGKPGNIVSFGLTEELLAGASTVLVRLPRGLEPLTEIAWAIASFADADVRVFAGDRVKHMTRAQNEVLAKYFADVSAGLGWRKSRVLTALMPGKGGTAEQASDHSNAPFPKWGSDADIPFRLAALGATFGGAKLDHGSRLLLATLELRADDAARAQAEPHRLSDPAAPRRVLDLGCGNGVLATAAALRWPDAEIIATDQSAAAVQATRLTAEAAGVAERVQIHRADGTEAVPDGWADLVLLNPPFHAGATVHSGVGHRLIRDVARVLRPGGELRLVFNSHLGYRPLVSEVIGETAQLARNKTFTVLAARARGGRGPNSQEGRA